jgi:hypothetical protein
MAAVAPLAPAGPARDYRFRRAESIKSFSANTSTMGEDRDISYYGPRLFAAIGLVLILFAVYVAGGDELTCARQGGQFNCQLVNRRWLNLVVSGRQDIPDVVGLFVRRTESAAGDQPFEDSVKMTVNDALVLKTRQGEEVPTLGGEPARDFASQLHEAMRGTDTRPLTALNSYWPISAGCFGIGAFFALFGGVAIFKD